MGDPDRQRLPGSAGNRDEWRYYPEGLAPRSVSHVSRMDFMRIDFHDDLGLSSLITSVQRVEGSVDEPRRSFAQTYQLTAIS